MSEPALAWLAAVCDGDDDQSFSVHRRARAGNSATPSHSSAPSNPAAEGAIVARIVLGDAQAFRELIVQHFDPLVRFAGGMVGDRDTAEDIVQAVLTRLWERHREFTPGTSVRAYLYRAVRNRSLDALEHAAVRARGQAILLHEQQAENDRSSSDQPDVEALRQALETLTERRRTALRLRYEEGLSYPEIAAIMAISTGSAEQLVFHAIRALRVALGVRDQR